MKEILHRMLPGGKGICSGVASGGGGAHWQPVCCNVANALSYWQPKLKLAPAPANRQTHGNMAKAQVCRRQNYAVNKSFFFFFIYFIPTPLTHTHTQLSYRSICRLKLHALTAFYGFLTVAATVASSCCLLPAACSPCLVSSGEQKKLWNRKPAHWWHARWLLCHCHCCLSS